MLICAYDDPTSITRFSVGEPTQRNSKTPDFAESDNRMAAAIRAMNPERAEKSNGDAFAWAYSEGNNPFYNRYVWSKTNTQVPFETRRGQRLMLWP